MVKPADELVSTFPNLARSKGFPAQVRSTTPFEMTLAKPTAAITPKRFGGSADVDQRQFGTTITMSIKRMGRLQPDAARRSAPLRVPTPYFCPATNTRMRELVHSITNQICRKLRQAAGLRLRPPVLDLDVLAFDIARRTQALSEGT